MDKKLTTRANTRSIPETLGIITPNPSCSIGHFDDSEASESIDGTGGRWTEIGVEDGGPTRRWAENVRIKDAYNVLDPFVMTGPSHLTVPGTKVAQDLKLVAGLQDMQDSGQLPLDPMSPGIPPAMFGAGGPMLKQFDQSTVVGLPARGKSYLSNKLMIYLKWLEYDVKVGYNICSPREMLHLPCFRSLMSDSCAALVQGRRLNSEHPQASLEASQPTNFALSAVHNNTEANLSREKLAHDSLEMLIQWLKDGGNVGIHDATNSTRARRASMEARVAKEKGIQLIFLESQCDDPAVIAANVALKVSSGDPDYKGMDPEDAKRDFLRRISEYEKVYEAITEPHLSYLKIVNVGAQVEVSRIHGYLQSRIAFYLMNLHLKPRSIYLSRHGESQFNVEGKIGGDSLLSPNGEKYMHALPALIKDNIGDAPLTVWTSTLRRTIQTASELNYPKLTWKSLDELDAGVCDAMTYEQAYPDDFANRDDDKFNYRYRGGESYRDVVVRLEPVIMELERQENILIIGHQAILRCLYAYFHHLPQVDLPYIKIPLHTVIKLTPKAYGCDEERYALPIQAVDTHRPKPKGHAPVVSTSTAREYYTGDTELSVILDLGDLWG
ncbi:hypothetical protein NLJ89_g10837 [Agrocybe chaxingu]|uniref:fructose-2,6-bisphosphate 2-phosphatase n=1 Tax=Agrocybe chaxingu TaxID=84603 RepID=A0A9W8JN18_9AGAR|nr:hypothetical protein NLJ89_g10837 [Agrocybe chaxingu]